MSLFRNKNPFDNDPFGLKGNTINSVVRDTANAKLYLFSPYKIDNAVIRPYVYNPNGNDLNREIYDLMNKRRDDFVSSLSGSIRNGFYLDQSKAGHEALMPSNSWYEYKTNFISDNAWKFILIINNAKNSSNRFVKINNNRLIYTGYVLDEPVSTAFGRNTVNENAVFFITHHTTMYIQNQITPMGENPVCSTYMDVDLLSSGLMHSGDYHNREYILDPAKMIETNTFAYDVDTGDGISTESKVVAMVDERPHLENSYMNNPKQHMNHLMSGLFRVISEDDRSNILGGDRSIDTFGGVRDRFSRENQLRNYLGGDKQQVLHGLDLSRSYHTFAAIINAFPNITKDIEIIDIRADETEYGLSELEKAPNPFNIYSSLIKSSVPPLMANWGVSDCAFRWASSNPSAFVTKLNREPVIQVYDFKTVMPEAQEVSKQKFHALLADIERTVFSTIYETVGEFEVYINYSSGNKIVVQLQLRDLTDSINDTYVVGQNNLGGIISPLIGTESEYYIHKQKMEQIMDIADNISEVHPVQELQHSVLNPPSNNNNLFNSNNNNIFARTNVFQ